MLGDTNMKTFRFKTKGDRSKYIWCGAFTYMMAFPCLVLGFYFLKDLGFRDSVCAGAILFIGFTYLFLIVEGWSIFVTPWLRSRRK